MQLKMMKNYILLKISKTGSYVLKTGEIIFITE